MLKLVSLCGVAVMLAICFALSNNRRAINWRLVGVGLVLQALLGFTFLYWDAGNAALQAVGRGVNAFFGLAQKGIYFVFNELSNPARIGYLDRASREAAGEVVPPGDERNFVFAIMVLPTLIFFASFMAVLYKLGVMQVIVRGMAWLMVRLLGTSGSESLSACANVFVGQTEAPLLVKPFLKSMTMSELHAIMVGGFATIAGGVFVLYVGFVGGPDTPENAAHRALVAGQLMVASVMAVPAGLICSKMLWPETERSHTLGKVDKIEGVSSGNVVEAAASGASDGLSLALNVGAMLIAFLGLLAVVNAGLGLVHPDLSLQLLLAKVFYPIAAVMGVPAAEIGSLSQLLGTKIVATELIAYGDLGNMVKAGAVSPRTAMIASFALCGFANVGSVAIQVGGLGAIAPERRGDLARLGLRAMFAGALATCMTACVAGVLANDGGAP